MRITLVFAALVLVSPAIAEDVSSNFRMDTINGVRVWSPKPSPMPAYVPPPPQQTIVIESQAPEQTYDPGLLYYPGPFFVGPRFPHRHPHLRPQHPTQQFIRPGRHF